MQINNNTTNNNNTTKKKACSSGNEDSKKKERHIVSWSQEEDDILRQQISLHGTENWAIIASKFKDKTTRQCRRRWYTYLNSDFKKGGWSPEEDLLLCEAQKIFGNRWTEIAKVVSGRTDNAVKNRFSTLCKKRAKYEALAKENTTSYMNSNNKRVMLRSGFSADQGSETMGSAKKMRRTHVADLTGSCDYRDRLHKPSRTTTINQQLRAPFTVLVQNSHNVNKLPAQNHVSIIKEIAATDAQNNKYEGSFLKKDDPKINALMQQAELLSSLALKVNTENTDQSLESAWKMLQDFLNQNKESDILGYRISDLDFQLEDFKDLLDELRSGNEGSQPSWRQPDLYDESPDSSEYSTGSTIMSHPTCNKQEQIEPELGATEQDAGHVSQSMTIGEESCVGECDKGMLCGATTEQAEMFPTCDEGMNNDQVVSALSSTEFSSPIHVTPLFRSLAAGIPSPKFSESERSFLLKTLGMESPYPCQGTNSAQPPPCKRALLHSL